MSQYCILVLVFSIYICSMSHQQQSHLPPHCILYPPKQTSLASVKQNPINLVHNSNHKLIQMVGCYSGEVCLKLARHGLRFTLNAIFFTRQQLHLKLRHSGDTHIQPTNMASQCSAKRDNRHEEEVWVETWRFSQIVACIRGVWPILSVASISAPSSNKNSQMSDCPALAARCNAVHPTCNLHSPDHQGAKGTG